MQGTTHDPLALLGGIVGALALTELAPAESAATAPWGAPGVAAATIASAYCAARLPDQIEKPVVYHALVSRIPAGRVRGWLLADHRGWSHWPVPTGVMAMIVAGLLVSVLIPLEAARRLKPWRDIGRRSSRQRQALLVKVAVIGGLVWLAVTGQLQWLAAPVGVGVLIGFWMHLVADLCTKSGLFGVHLLPKWLRITTGGDSDQAVKVSAWLAVATIAYLQVQAL